MALLPVSSSGVTARGANLQGEISDLTKKINEADFGRGSASAGSGLEVEHLIQIPGFCSASTPVRAATRTLPVLLLGPAFDIKISESQSSRTSFEKPDVSARGTEAD